MTNDLVAPAAAAGAGAAVGSTVVAASGYTAIGVVGGGAGAGMALGPVGAVGGAVVGLAAYGLLRMFGDMGAEGRYYAHLNWLRDRAPQTGPAAMYCRYCQQDLWPRPVNEWPGKSWRNSEDSNVCPSHAWHDAQPKVWR